LSSSYIIGNQALYYSNIHHMEIIADSRVTKRGPPDPNPADSLACRGPGVGAPSGYVGVIAAAVIGATALALVIGGTLLYFCLRKTAWNGR